MSFFNQLLSNNTTWK